MLARDDDAHSLPRSAAQIQQAVQIVLLCVRAAHKEKHPDRWRGLVDELPDGFAERSPIDAKAHELVPLEVSLRVKWNRGRGREERSVDPHLTQIFADTHMDHTLGLEQECAGPLRLKFEVVDAKLHPWWNEDDCATRNGIDTCRIAHRGTRIEFRFELRSGTFQRAAY